jgi:hypothetical protein
MIFFLITKCPIGWPEFRNEKLIELNDQNGDANIFLLNAHTFLARNEDFGGLRMQIRGGD